ncbi:MAG TPA: response regulator transcription factor [Solirubrobacteraceae bacterium]|nr:response regulator transcription factor [Solirubrobacteraceae bacterium]
MDETAYTILIVEDHLVTRSFLADNLVADGYDLLEADSATQAERLIECSCPDLAIIDLGLPDRDGLDLLSHIRDGEPVAGRIDPSLPVLVLTGRAGELDRLRGFERGCDDYVAKPFSYQELRARIRALLRRTAPRTRSGRLRVGRLELDPASREVWLAGEPLRLSKKEFALLRALAAEPTRVFSREELLRGVWGFKVICPTRTVDAHAHRLRKKLGVGGDRFVVNVWGVGYRLVDGNLGG